MVKNSFGSLDMLLLGVPVTKDFHLLWVVCTLFSWLKYLWDLSLGRSETPSNQTLEGIKFTRISSILYFFDVRFWFSRKSYRRWCHDWPIKGACFFWCTRCFLRKVTCWEKAKKVFFSQNEACICSLTAGTEDFNIYVNEVSKLI